MTLRLSGVGSSACSPPFIWRAKARRLWFSKRAIRAQEPDGVRVPIIALTARAMRSDQAACLEAGMDDYATKPFTRQSLHAVLRRWLSAAA